MSTAQALRVDDLNHVERELLRMRARESGSSVRATTLNLVAFAGNDDHLNRTVDALQLIGGSRPLRAIVTVPGDGATSAEVSSTCWRNVSGQEVRSEQIVVTARPDTELPRTVSSYALALAPDEKVRHYLEQRNVPEARKMVADAIRLWMSAAARPGRRKSG